ncbi:hypothetical protein JW887_01570 [Candidatus Dojkabacteria bacterium]|nr:hypothetical protein [Candidatus Dojkabacteria bacterium]
MGAMSLICKKLYPKCNQVFVGPCITKKNEAAEIGGIDLAITFKELSEYFDKNPIDIKTVHKKSFNKFYNDYTKIYPVSGGLSDTLHHEKVLDGNQILVMDGIANLMPVFNEFKDGFYKDYLFLDCLSCNGGCIAGPGINNTLDLESRRKKVLAYKNFAMNNEKDLERRGMVHDADGIDFKRIF